MQEITALRERIHTLQNEQTEQVFYTTTQCVCMCVCMCVFVCCAYVCKKKNNENNTNYNMNNNNNNNYYYYNNNNNNNNNNNVKDIYEMLCAISSSIQERAMSLLEEVAWTEIVELNRKCQFLSFIYFHAATLSVLFNMSISIV